MEKFERYNHEHRSEKSRTKKRYSKKGLDYNEIVNMIEKIRKYKSSNSTEEQERNRVLRNLIFRKSRETK